MARFLVATMPVPGHVAPIAPVVGALVEHGHEVVWYTSQHFAADVAHSGATLAPITTGIDFGDSDYDRHFPGREQLDGLRQVVFDFEHLFVGSVPGYVTDLRRLHAELGSDVLVTDPAVAAGHVLAEIDEVPTATINVTVLGLAGRDVAPFGLGLPPLGGPVGRARNAALTALVDQVIFRRPNQAYRRLATENGWPVKPFRPAATRFLYIQPGIPELEYPRSDLPEQVHFVGALLPDPPGGFSQPSWWAELLAARAAGRKVVLVTQGTIATDPTRLFQPTLEALGYEDVFLVAAGLAPEDLPHKHPNAVLSRFVPFRELMPYVDAFVTNGGFGGVSIALVNGVPVVCSGTTEDKAEVGGRVAYAGVGINLRTDRPTAEQVYRAVMAVLTEPTYRDRAVRVQAAFAGRDGPAESAQLLEELARTGQPVLSRR